MKAVVYQEPSRVTVEQIPAPAGPGWISSHELPPDGAYDAFVERVVGHIKVDPKPQ